MALINFHTWPKLILQKIEVLADVEIIGLIVLQNKCQLCHNFLEI